MKNSLLMCVAFLLLACSSGSEGERPPYLLDDDKFVAVLTEVQLLEATYKQKIIREEDPNEVMPIYYKQIFEKHEVTQADFEDTYAWWMERPREMLDMYNRVIDQLTKLEKEHLETDQ